MDSGAELAKTSPSPTSSTRHRGESWHGARKEDTTNINIIKMDRRHGAHGTSPPISTSSRWSPRHGAKKITHTLGVARNTEQGGGAVRDLEEKMVPHDALHDPEPKKMRRDGEEAA